MDVPFPSGSVWRKWDLHLHAPGTKLSDCYQKVDGKPDYERFCRALHDSDVDVFGVTDYFSFDGYFEVSRTYQEMYPDNQKLLLPNLELRLPLNLNRSGENVNLHLLFPPSLTSEEAEKFLGHLITEETYGSVRGRVSCLDLQTGQFSKEHLESVTVSLSSIENAIKMTFGEHAVHRSERLKYLLVITSAKGDGIRPGGKGIKRKNILSDEVDKYSDGFFGNSSSTGYYLDTRRLESGERTLPKPVFDGCDAHSFEQLASGLGKHTSVEGAHRNITWIKSDPTYGGLLQTFVEPEERVRISPTQPDVKEPYQVIDRVTFANCDNRALFPNEVRLNPNLNSVIGSRSSGKSSLLAYIAHAVDPEETIRVQLDTMDVEDADRAKARTRLGPAAGITWEEVQSVQCEVHWASGADTKGKVIYIPQSSLYKLSERPGEITKKIAPVIFGAYPDIETSMKGAEATVAESNNSIRSAIREWFELSQSVAQLDYKLKDLGDEEAIRAESERLQKEIGDIQSEANLSDPEIELFRKFQEERQHLENKLKALSKDQIQVEPYNSSPQEGNGLESPRRKVDVQITITPPLSELPQSVASQIENLQKATRESLVSQVELLLNEFSTDVARSEKEVQSELARLLETNQQLIEKHAANEELTKAVESFKKQDATLQQMAGIHDSLSSLHRQIQDVIQSIQRSIATRNESLEELESIFNSRDYKLDELSFALELGVDPNTVSNASIGISRSSVNEFVEHRGADVSYKKAQADPEGFLRALKQEQLTLKKGAEAESVAAAVLTVTPEVRFAATLDGDHIGGFQRSSMTPGKQALFALMLTLNSSQDAWPLLIDQPEDDLDSRSIYDTIVPYLKDRKRERQIIMVSHNASLVIGADSEQIIVANRHGADRANQDGRTFDYLTGSLEHSQALDNESLTTLGRFGIREHACEILDGGEEAFRKRQEKYRSQVES